MRDSEHAELLAAHKSAHLLDLAGLPGDTDQSRRQTVPDMQELLQVIWDTARGANAQDYSETAGAEEKARSVYDLRPHELFARAYAQQGSDRRMLHQLDARMDDAERTHASSCRIGRRTCSCRLRGRSIPYSRGRDG